MKRSYLIMVFLVVFSILAVLIFLFVVPDSVREQAPNEDVSQISGKTAQEEDAGIIDTENNWGQFEDAYMVYTDGITYFLDKFFDLTYNCDYSERYYYEGAEAFMTEECYSYYVPVQTVEEIEGSAVGIPTYKTSLQGTDYYFASLEEAQAECLAFVQFSVSGSSHEIQESLFLLSLIQSDGKWEISSIETLDY